MTHFDKDNEAALNFTFDETVVGRPEVVATTILDCLSSQTNGELFAVLATDRVALTRLLSDHRKRVTQALETGSFQAGERTVTKRAPVTTDDVAEPDSLVPHSKVSYEPAVENSD